MAFTNLVKQLESNNWESVSHNAVSVGIAKAIKSGEIKTNKPKFQIVARIQCILVWSGKYTDDSFIEELLG